MFVGCFDAFTLLLTTEGDDKSLNVAASAGHIGDDHRRGAIRCECQGDRLFRQERERARFDDLARRFTAFDVSSWFK